jgi:hypothetical protein
MHSHDAVVHFALSATPLPLDSYRVRPAFARRRLVDDSHGVRVPMLGSHDLLTTVAQSPLIPLDGFEKTL